MILTRRGAPNWTAWIFSRPAEVFRRNDKRAAATAAAPFPELAQIRRCTGTLVPMTWTLYAFLALLGFGIIALISYLVRLNRQSRRVARRLDYSKMREWKDDD